MIFFIGMPGSGKSYWASTIATAYDLPYTDLDQHLEERVRMPISEYFQKFGESEFRLREEESLIDVIENNARNSIVACGGGTPAFSDNLQKMKLAGCTIYLRASLSAIMKRLEASPTRRPLLEGRDMATALMELYDKRELYFSQADHIFDIDRISVANFEEIINSCTSRP